MLETGRCPLFVAILALLVLGMAALGDMTSSSGDWIFVNLAAANGVALIDPISGATPVAETVLPTGERQVHIYRDPSDGEVIWSMNDGNAVTGVDGVNCATRAQGSVTVLPNSHLGPGGTVPKVVKTLCFGAGHKVTAFARPTTDNKNIAKRAFITSANSGEMTVIDADESSGTSLTILKKIDLCDSAKETTACDTNVETANHAHPHGIAWSVATGKVYSYQEEYENIIEVDPTTMAVTRKVDIAPFMSYGITPDGKYLLLRGTDKTSDPAHVKGLLGAIDLTAATLTVVQLPAIPDVSPGSFKFSPDSKALYLIVTNTDATWTGAQKQNAKQDKMLAINATGLPNALVTVKEIDLLASAADHSQDLHVHDGALKHVWVTNKSDNSVSVINATSNTIVQRVPVGNAPGGLMVYESSKVSGAAHDSTGASVQAIVIGPDPAEFGDAFVP